MQMTSRERIKAAIRYQPVDRLPVQDSPWEQVPDMWAQQGMPVDTALGVTAAAADYFGFDMVVMSLDASPRFKQKIIDRSGGYVTYEDRFGYTVKKPDGKSGTMDFLSCKTTGRAAWESLVKPGFVLDDSDRQARIDTASYFAHFDPYPTWEDAREQFQRHYSTDKFTYFCAYGPWEATWRHRGYDGLLMDLAADPEFVQEMSDTYMDLVLKIMARCVELDMKPDGFIMVEDLGCNRGMLFSPHTWRKVFQPATRRLGDFLGEHQIDFLMHCCGNAETIFHDLIDCGVRVMEPLQVMAGLDVVELRKKYAPRLAFWGNIHAKAMAGPIEPLGESIRRKVAGALDGGYIFASDHSIPPDVSFQRYRWIIEEARKAASPS